MGFAGAESDSGGSTCSSCHTLSASLSRSVCTNWRIRGTTRLSPQEISSTYHRGIATLHGSFMLRDRHTARINGLISRYVKQASRVHYLRHFPAAVLSVGQVRYRSPQRRNHCLPGYSTRRQGDKLSVRDVRHTLLLNLKRSSRIPRIRLGDQLLRL